MICGVMSFVHLCGAMLELTFCSTFELADMLWTLLERSFSLGVNFLEPPGLWILCKQMSRYERRADLYLCS
jgi:hypothetical protein